MGTNKKRLLINVVVAFMPYIGYGQAISLQKQHIEDSLHIVCKLEKVLQKELKFAITDSIIGITREQYINDSLKFINKLNDLMIATTRYDVEIAARGLDYKLTPRKWYEYYSTEIIKKLAPYYKTDSYLAELLSLTNLPDSIRAELLNGNNTLCKARLGDSISLCYYIDKYKEERNKNDENYRDDGMCYWLKILLSFDSKIALDVVFKDIESTRIIKQCENPDNDDTNDCFIAHRTYVDPILEVLMEKHKNDPIFNRSFVGYYLRIAWNPRMKNPYIPIYFKWLEDFIYREYGYKVKINVPYVIAVEE
jgi:hypothetical protein